MSNFRRLPRCFAVENLKPFAITCFKFKCLGMGTNVFPRSSSLIGITSGANTSIKICSGLLQALGEEKILKEILIISVGANVGRMVGLTQASKVGTIA